MFGLRRSATARACGTDSGHRLRGARDFRDKFQASPRCLRTRRLARSESRRSPSRRSGRTTIDRWSRRSASAGRLDHGYGEPGPGCGKHEVMANESDAAVITASLDDPGRFRGALRPACDRGVPVSGAPGGCRRRGGPAGGSVPGRVREARDYDGERLNPRPWLYGIATNLLAHHRRAEARRIGATRVKSPLGPPRRATDQVVERLDAEELWPRRRAVHRRRRQRDALLLYGRAELRRDGGASMYRWVRAVATESEAPNLRGTPSVDRERTVSDDFDQLRQLRPDGCGRAIQSNRPSSPERRSASCRRSTRHEKAPSWFGGCPTSAPPGLRRRRAALDYLTRVFKLVEIAGACGRPRSRCSRGCGPATVW